MLFGVGLGGTVAWVPSPSSLVDAPHFGFGFTEPNKESLAPRRIEMQPEDKPLSKLIGSLALRISITGA